jgi:hypothetical protein
MRVPAKPLLPGGHTIGVIVTGGGGGGAGAGCRGSCGALFDIVLVCVCVCVCKLSRVREIRVNKKAKDPTYF